MIPPEEIDDPKDKKPKDWDDREKSVAIETRSYLFFSLSLSLSLSLLLEYQIPKQ